MKRTDCIARIDPLTGEVKGWIMMHGMKEEMRAIVDRDPSKYGNHRMDVLNGIAYDAAKKRIFVTGKLWPK